MKHHEYQLYYGGHKYLLAFHTYCEDCHKIIKGFENRIAHQQLQKNHVRSHKKQTGKPRFHIYRKHVIPKKN